MDKAQARTYLKKLFAKDKTVYTKMEHVSRNGMLRIISVYVIRRNQPINISPEVAAILGDPLDKNILGVRVGGCGMDMGFHVVYSLSQALYHPRDRAGYVLKHRWM